MTGQTKLGFTQEEKADAALTRRVMRKRAAVRFNLLAERLLPALLWPACILALYVSFSWLGLFHLLPYALRLSLVLAMAAGFVVSLWSLRKVRFPSSAEAVQRLERNNALSHQAISVRTDHPAHETPEGMALWRAHQRRMAETVKNLDPGLPSPDFSVPDPYGLRSVPVLLLFVAFFYAGATGSGRLTDAFLPPAEKPETAIALRFDAWISPPAYTRRAPVYLQKDGSDAVADIPAGSVLTVRLSGNGAPEAIRFLPQAAETPQEPSESQSSDMVSSASYLLSESGMLEAAGRRWRIDVVPDTPPVIAFKTRPRGAANGALELEYTLADDYGVTAARAEIVPAPAVVADGAEPVYPLPEFSLNMPARSSEDHSSLTSRNITEHPLSGKTVLITLIAEDAAGNIGKSAPEEVTLPSRPFYNMLAASVAEQRQIFALDTREMPQALQYSHAITLRPEETIPDLTQFLLITSAQTRMAMANDEASYRDTADYMWQIATGIEDGELSEAERRLREAQDALSEALENGASDAEIAALMAELRQAMQDYLSEMAQRMQPSDMQQSMTNQQMLRQRDLDNLLNQLENLARSGDRDAARQLLSELQRMMNNLQPPSSMAQQGGQQNSEMRQQVDKLGELIQEQQQLMNETFELDQQLRDREQWGDLQPSPGDLAENGEKAPRDMTAEELRQALKQLQEQQQGLAEQLSKMQQKLSELGMPPAEGFDQAGEAMEGAAGALGEGEGSEAVEGQGNALEALRQGAQQMMNSLMAGQGQQGQGPGGQTGWGKQAGRDPLGRNSGTDGLDFGNNVEVPDEITVQRAREILDAIRERLNQDAPLPSEPPYLERLLEPQSQN